MDQEYELSATTVIRDCLGVKPEERLLVITDYETERIGRALFEVGLKMGAESILMVMKPRTRHGEEPPRTVAEAMKSCDVFVAPTRYSLTHTQARKAATEAGVRGATMPGITEEIFLGGALKANYNEVKVYAEKIQSAMQGKRMVRVVAPAGTDILFSIENRQVYADTGILREPKAFGNLPAGETYVAPVEGTARGKIVFDISISSIGILKVPVEIVVEDGFAVDFKGGEEAERFRELLSSVNRKEAFNIAEFGVGCNPGATIIGNVLQDEKVFGTVHIALGDNSTFGGRTIAGIHLDGIIKRPTVYVDDKLIIKNGEWLI